MQGTKSRWRILNNGLPQGSVLAPMLFNIYTNDQPILEKTKHFLYADDLALAAQTSNFEEAEKELTAALEILDHYYKDNGLRPNPSKTQSCVFHIRNREANRHLKISWQGVPIQHCPKPRYLGITLDRSLTFKTHCQNTQQKVTARNNLVRRLTSASWGAAPHVVRTTSLALSFTAGEYACAVWHRSAHASMIDSALNDTCRIITGCLKPTPLIKLYPLAGIAPPSVRRQIICSTEKLRQENDARHPLYSHIPPNARLKSRKSFMRHTVALSDRPETARLNMWTSRFSPPSEFIPPAEHLPLGHKLQWPTWKSLNRLRTQVGRCKANRVKWGYLDPSQDGCECGAPTQDMAHLTSCPLSRETCTMEDLREATDRAIVVAKFWANHI